MAGVPEPTSELAITALGHRGDGIASTAGGEVYVPFSLAGERVRARVSGSTGKLIEVIEPAAERIEPICPHFGVCGGCQLQHMALPAYLEFKRTIIVRALDAHGLRPVVDPVAPIPTSSRRRATFTARRTRSGALAFGYSVRKTHEVADIRTCPILVPDLARRIGELRGLAKLAVKGNSTLKLHVLNTETGLDVVLEGGRDDPGTRQKLVNAGLAMGLARLSYPGDTIVETAAPQLTVAGTPVFPGAGTFVQAAAESEHLIGRIVADTLRGAGAAAVADLFCGLGTFALRLAAFARVDCLDGDQAALDALDRAVRHRPGLKPVRISRRDLFRNPLTARELDRHDAVVFDPPRAGAERQALELAKSSVPTVVAVSCNPLTLARDLAILVAGGFRIALVKPVDQFVFSPHIEVVAVCVRDG